MPRRIYFESPWAYALTYLEIISKNTPEKSHLSRLEISVEKICEGNPGLRPVSFICTCWNEFSSWSAKALPAYAQKVFLPTCSDYYRSHPRIRYWNTPAQCPLDRPQLLFKCTWEGSHGLYPEIFHRIDLSVCSSSSVKAIQTYDQRVLVSPPSAFDWIDPETVSKTTPGKTHSDSSGAILKWIRGSNPGLRPEGFVCVYLSVCPSWSIKAVQSYAWSVWFAPPWAYARGERTKRSNSTFEELHLTRFQLMFAVIQQSSPGLCPACSICIKLRLWSRGVFEVI